MKKVLSLNLSHLINSEHVEVMEFTVRTFERFPFIEERFPQAVMLFRSATAHEEQAFQKENHRLLSQDIQQAHKDRILRFRALNDILKGATLSAEPAQVEAATFLRHILKGYGGASRIMKFACDDMSGVFTIICEAFMEENLKQAIEAGVVGHVEELRRANEAYLSLRSERTEVLAKRNKGAMEKARPKSDAEWRALMELISLSHYYDGNDQLLPFIQYMNTKISDLRTQLKIRAGRKKTAILKTIE